MGVVSSEYVVTRFANNRIEVVEAEEYERPDFSNMISRVWEIKQKHGISNLYCDASNPEIWQALKKEFGEPYNQQYINDQRIECRKYNFHLEDRMIVVPVPFQCRRRPYVTAYEMVDGRDRGRRRWHL